MTIRPQNAATKSAIAQWLLQKRRELAKPKLK